MIDIISSKKYLNIVSLDNPYPPDYGGVIDIFYKIIALKNMGFKICLHCYYYDRVPSRELEKYCYKIYYYKRKINYLNIFSSHPFIVKSRADTELINNLNQNNYPILFEGIHTCKEISNPALSKRKKIIRMHNIEYKYYRALSEFINNPIKKYLYKLESKKLYNYEKFINYSDLLCVISDYDFKIYSKIHKNVIKLPVFHGCKIYNSTNSKKYALYHGNFKVSENEYTALYLVNKIFCNINYKLIIAGKNPSNKIKNSIKLTSNVSLKENVTQNELDDLIANARMHILPAFQSSGIKLKLIHALNSTGHIITNKKMLTDYKLEKLCNLVETSEEMKKIIIEKSKTSLSKNELAERKLFLDKNYSNKRSVEILIDKIIT